MGETGEKHADETKSSAPKKKQSSSKPKRKEDREKEEKEAAELQRKAELETKIRDRVACEAKAFDVVNRLIEPDITAEYLLDACKLIDHSHYEDIVEERTISRLCGYPVCSNKLTQVAKQKYHISTRTNTVYDITERKKFCSNECYRASQFLQKQIPQTPVWTRRDEPAIKFELLQPKVNKTLEGEEVIGSSMFSLKEEISLLEKLDLKTKKPAPSTAKDKPASRESQEESQRLSDKLLSLSTEEDLGNKMEDLSLGTKDEKVPESKASGSAGAASGLVGALTTQERNVPEARVVCREESLGLEARIESLTLKDTASQNAADSDDEEDEKKGGDAERIVQLTDSSPTPVLQDSAKTNCIETSKNPVATKLKQQPGESKAAYLMRLLDKRQKLFSKVADIQESTDPKPHLLESSHPSVENKDDGKKMDSAKILETDCSEEAQPAELAKQSEGSVDDQVARDTSSSISTSKQADQKTTSPSRTSLTNSQAASRSLQPPVSPLNSVCQIVSEWFTPETLSYLGLVTAQGQSEVESLASSSFHKDPEVQKKYQDLCQRLADQEKDLSDILGEDNVEEKDSMSGRKPLPNFEELKQQTQEYQVKVQQFFAGPSVARKKMAKGDGGDNEDAPESDRPVVLPVIDSHNQLLIRRRIVLERLDRTMPSLLPPLGLSVQDVSAPMRELVFTFTLTSHNIVFKPAEWTLVAVVLLRVLAVKSQTVAGAFQSQSRCTTFNMVLSHLGHSCSSLGQLVDSTLSKCKDRVHTV